MEGEIVAELTTAQAIVRWLAAQKITIDGEVKPYFPFVFSIFGHGNALSLGDALFDAQEVLPTLRGQTEEGMGLAGVAYAKAMRGQQSAVITTSIGPGALNVVTAAGTALANRLPMLILSGETFNSRIPDPVLQQVEHFGAPSITVNDAFRAVVRYWDRITSPTQILTSLPQALMTMLDPATRGPAFIGLPQDVQAATFDFPDRFFDEKVHEFPRPRADRNEIDLCAALINNSKKPVLIAGGGIHYSLAENELAEFASKHGIPVVETMAGKASLLWSNPSLIGPLGITGSDPVNALIEESDLVLAIGTRLQDFTTGSWTLFKDKELVAINTARFDASKRHAYAVVGDARATLHELSGLISRKAEDIWLEIAKTRKAECERDREDRKNLHSVLPTYAQIVIATNETASEHDYVLTAAGGLPGELNNNWFSKGIASFDCEYGFSCMGYEISGALGAAIAQKKEKRSGRVIALTGDGSYLMLNSDIYSAVLLDYPLTLIVCDNGGYAVISRLQTGHGAPSFRTMLTEYPDAPRVDFVAHAASMGAETYKVTSVEELASTISKTKESVRTVVIVIESAPTTWTEGGAFWEVGIPQVSTKSGVKDARKAINEGKKNQRIY
ncbi:MAG: 3D-(3,5/4)-trihydroxycyclohexane-1,2-dione acylhydrolase (decyclizing) [Actinobacteria bacterium]|nr:3D-(3,5/4)-trihydroxycyclohexane-1,2-dione acylhydrolase (decyclizing) [Actinomycetota bacterium]